MSGWSSEELQRIATADELHLASVRGDGAARREVTIWVVRHGDDVYVRSWNGPDGAWFRSVQARPEAHISAGGVSKDVRLVPAGADVNDAVDAAYRSKYEASGGGFVADMTRPEAQATTMRIVPRSGEG